MALIKHAERTNRKPCYCHGSTLVYWAHDSEQLTDAKGRPVKQCDCGATGRMVLVDANDFTRTIPQGGIIPEEHLHQKGRGAETPAPEAGDAEAAPEAPKPATPPVIPPAAATAAAPPADAATALMTLMQSLTPQVDEATVKRLVEEKFNATVFPTRTVILTPEGEDVTPEDLPDTTHEQFADVLRILSAAKSCPVPMSVLMVGPAGSGKSTIAKDAAKALGYPYGEISLNPMLPVTSLLGYMNATGEYVKTVFREIWEEGGVFLLDEFDNAHPSTMATLNAALACPKGGSIAFPDGMVERSDEFIGIASANTFGRGPDRVYVGRQQLDAATLNRFVTVEIGYDEALEHSMCLATGLDNEKVAESLRYVRAIRRNITSKKMTVLVTPRNAAFMCTLLKAGMSRDAVIAMTVRQGISDADWSKATEGVVPLGRHVAP